jgi:hypothetical protein
VSTDEVRARLIDNATQIGEMLAAFHDPPYTVRELQLMYDILANMETAKVLALASSLGYECRVAERFVLTDAIGRAWVIPKDVTDRLKERDA